jgi:hypothetical protein
MPTGFLGNSGDDVTIFALADHQGRLVGGIGPVVANGREKLLMPAAQYNLATVLQVLEPDLFVFHVETEGPTVDADEMIQRTLKHVR